MSLLDESALAILDVILEEGGVWCHGGDGQVLKNLAEAANVPYKRASLCVLYLEQAGLVQVRRQDHPEAHRANKIQCVEAT